MVGNVKILIILCHHLEPLYLLNQLLLLLLQPTLLTLQPNSKLFLLLEHVVVLLLFCSHYLQVFLKLLAFVIQRSYGFARCAEICITLL